MQFTTSYRVIKYQQAITNNAIAFSEIENNSTFHTYRENTIYISFHTRSAPQNRFLLREEQSKCETTSVYVAKKWIPQRCPD